MNKYRSKMTIAMVLLLVVMASGCTREVNINKDDFIKATDASTEFETEIDTTMAEIESTTDAELTESSLYLPEGEVADYTQLEDGTWEYKGQIYNYRHILSGIMPGNTVRSTIIVVSTDSYCNFEIYAEKIIEEGTIDVYTGSAGYKIVECYHHDNALLNGRYISEQDGDTLFIELDYETVNFWDFGANYGVGNVEIDSSVSMPSYYDECKYMIVGNYIKILNDDTKSIIEIVDDSTLEYNGVRYIHEDSSSKEEVPVLSKTGYPQYDELIQKIVSIHETGNGARDLYEENDICYIYGYESAFEVGGIIYMIYTICDGELQKVCSGGERDIFRLCEGKYIMEEGSGGAAFGVTAYYTFVNSQLKLQEAVVLDGFYDMDNPWFLCTESFDAATGVPITSEEAAAIIDKYHWLPIEFTLFVRPEYK